MPLTAIIGMICLKQDAISKITNRVDGVNAIIQENLTGIRVVKSFNRQKHEEKRFKEEI